MGSSLRYEIAEKSVGKLESGRGSEPTYEHACEVCRVSRFGDELIHGILGTERAVQLPRNSRQRAIRRLVRRPAAHIQLRYTAGAWCRRARCLRRRRALCAFDLELARCPAIAHYWGQHTRAFHDGKRREDGTRSGVGRI